MTDEMPTDPPATLLARWSKDPRLVPYGGGNFGTPPELLDPEAVGERATVPTPRFFMRSNGPVPELDAAAWRLRIGGHVAGAVDLSLADLRAMRQHSLTAFLECAGNGRTQFDPLPTGTPWRNDAVGNADWEGVPLAALLDLAGVEAGAVDVVAQGGDMPGMRRGLPLAIARDPDTLVVLRMNGEDLGVAHGGPARLLVPGWAGIASTKWLVGLEVLDHAFAGFWNADNYVFWTAAGEAVAPIREMPPKSIIFHPAAGATIAAGPQTVRGFAWSGYGRITTVEVSSDDGTTWREAALGHSERRAWARFELPWDAPPGPARLLARAVDERGLSQPAVPNWNAKGYLMNAIQVVDVDVVEITATASAATLG